MALRPRPTRPRALRGPRAPQPGMARRACSRPAAMSMPATCASLRRRQRESTGGQLGPRPALPTRGAAGAQRSLGAAHAPHRRKPTRLLPRAAVPALAGRRLTPTAEPALAARRRSPRPERGTLRRWRLRWGGRAARRRPCWGGAARAGSRRGGPAWRAEGRAARLSGGRRCGGLGRGATGRAKGRQLVGAAPG